MFGDMYVKETGMSFFDRRKEMFGESARLQENQIFTVPYIVLEFLFKRKNGISFMGVTSRDLE